MPSLLCQLILPLLSLFLSFSKEGVFIGLFPWLSGSMTILFSVLPDTIDDPPHNVSSIVLDTYHVPHSSASITLDPPTYNRQSYHVSIMPPPSANQKVYLAPSSDVPHNRKFHALPLVPFPLMYHIIHMLMSLQHTIAFYLFCPLYHYLSLCRKSFLIKVQERNGGCADNPTS